MKTNTHLSLREAVRKQINKCEECKEEPLQWNELLLAIQNSESSQQANNREVEFRYESYNQDEDKKNVLYIEVSDYVQGGDEPAECWDSWDIILDLTKQPEDQDEEVVKQLIELLDNKHEI